MKRHNICYVKTICLSLYIPFYILIIFIFVHPVITIFVQGKVYVYAFHLKQGGVV